MAWLALLGGFLQLVASVQLGTASLGALESAASEGSRLYVLATAVAGLGVWVATYLRRRPALALAALALWEGGLFLYLRNRTSVLGAAYWGESILHHFLALVAACGLLGLVAGWSRDRELPRWRVAPAALLALATGLLLAAHVGGLPRFRWPAAVVLQGAGTVVLLLGCAAARALLWSTTGSRALRVVTVAFLVPPLLRLAAAGTAGLRGAPVPDSLEVLVTGSIIAAATIAYATIRPRLEVWLHGIVTVGSALATAALYVAYRHQFGDLEPKLDGLTRSMFGFPLPYPGYVAGWKVMLVMLAVFFLISTVYACLVATRERHVGVALGLLAVTGIGMSSPQLLLMGGLGYAWLLDAARRQAPGRALQRPPGEPVPDVLTRVSASFQLGEPVQLSEKRGHILAVDGETDGVRLRIRARQRGAQWHLTLTAGLPGKDRPTCELIPDVGDGGARPAHPLGDSHRVKGELRYLETLGDPPLDALLSFPGARARIWTAGAEVELGDDLAAFQDETLSALIRSFVPLVR